MSSALGKRGTLNSHDERLQDRYASISIRRIVFCSIPAHNSFRTNPAKTLRKSQSFHNSLTESQLHIMYIQNIVANDRTDALPRSGAVAGGFCGALSAVPLLAAYFFKILLLTELQTDLKPFRDFFTQATTTFQPSQRYKISEFLASFFMNFIQDIQLF